MTETPNTSDYRTCIVSSLSEVGQPAWDALVRAQPDANPFLSFAFLHALHESGSASDEKGWQPQYLTLWREQALVAALPMYAKFHSYGEYVFDWAWADAYRRNGLDYYPKLLSAIPFTPVTGSRLIAIDTDARNALIGALQQVQRNSSLSSTHVLYPPEAEAQQLAAAGFMLRKGVQFHWQNQGWRDFDDFLASMTQEKRKKIRQERRKVRDAGVSFRAVRGPDMTDADWALLLRCYQQTYWEHGNAPYLTPAFFEAMRTDMAANWLLFVAEHERQPMGISLIGLHLDAQGQPEVAYGRYWGALARVDCLHFEACYYQPIEWCIQHGLKRFEGGAQGEHKMARALLPTPTHSAHWLAHPAFSEAVARFLEREKAGVENYLEALNQHSPLKKVP